MRHAYPTLNIAAYASATYDKYNNNFFGDIPPFEGMCFLVELSGKSKKWTPFSLEQLLIFKFYNSEVINHESELAQLMLFKSL